MTESVMEGHGSYNSHSHPQEDAAAHGIRRFADAARTMPLPAEGAATIADYGSSEGRNSLAPMSAAITAARDAHGSDLAIQVVHTDLPANDFSSLFETVVHDPASYLRPGVHALAAGRSFYEQLLPSGTVSLGWSSITVHWLSAAPAPMAAGIWSPSATPDVQAAWRERSARDWRAFLDARAAELLPGARLVIVGSGAGDAGDSGAEGAMAMIDRCLHEMVQAQTLSERQYATMAIPTWYRTAAEWEAPFPHPDLELELREPSVLDDPFWAAYEQTHDAHAYAVSAAGFLRAAFEPALTGPLPAADRARVADELFDRRLVEAIATDPPAASCRWQLQLLVIARR
jgi:hypothetical protein